MATKPASKSAGAESTGRYSYSSEFKEVEGALIYPCYNIGAGFDILSGQWMVGFHDERILSGGAALGNGYTGIANSFKSAMMEYTVATILKRFDEPQMDWAEGVKYDTEINTSEQHLLEKLRSYGLDPVDFFNIMGRQRLRLVPGHKAYLNDWFEIYKSALDKKEKFAKRYPTPFIDRDGKSPVMLTMPSPTAVDSFSMAKTRDVVDIAEDNELGDSGGNMIHMRGGLAKVRFLTEALYYMVRCNAPMFLTAHIGKHIPMDQRSNTEKKLQYLAESLKIKGVTDAFLFLTHILLFMQNAAVLRNKDTKAAEFIRQDMGEIGGDTDLVEITTCFLRNKNGPSGITWNVLASQREGILPALTEFNYCRREEYFGLIGGNRTYYSALYPSLTLSRNTVRTKLMEDTRLGRAMEVSCQMLQMQRMWSHLPQKYRIRPEEMAEKLTNMGYKLEELMETRGWWTVNNDKHPIPFLSSLDMIRMVVDGYHPYWMKKKPTDAFVAVPENFQFNPKEKMST